MVLEPALDVVASMVPRIEAERRLPREVVDAFVAAGIFKLMVPRAYGGADAPVREASFVATAKVKPVHRLDIEPTLAPCGPGAWIKTAAGAPPGQR